MPIPYRDVDDVEELGLAAYLRIVPAEDNLGYVGALFLINARGEPIEFTYNRIATPHTFLWRQDDIRRHAARKLTASILSLCPKTPGFILCLANEIKSELFCQDIQLSIPVCRLATAIEITSYSGGESQDTLKDPEPINLFWFPNRPEENSIEIRLIQELISRGLLIEPFERTFIGLKEVYGANSNRSL